MATYTQQCTKVGSFSYAGNFTLYVVLNDRDGNSSTNKSQVDYNVYCQSSGSGSISARHRRYFSLNGTTIIDTTETINASSPNAYIPIASGTMEIPHNDDGTKTIPFSAIIQGATYGVSASISGDFTLNTIPRTSSISCSTANIEENAVITISSASNSFTHTVIAYFGNETVTVATGKSGGSFQWTIPSSFYAQIPNSKTGVGTIRCQTYNGGTLIGTKDAVLNVSTSETRCKPSISGTVVDTNQTTINLTGNANKLIKYKSTAKATISTSAKNSASISKKVINGTTVSGNELSIANVSTTSFNFETVDSRGYLNSTTVTPQMIDYIPLTINANFFRPQPTTGEVHLKYSGNYFNGSFGATSNSLSITWKWKKHSDSSWTTGGTITPTISGNKITEKTISLGTNFDYQTAYDFQIIAVDKLTTFTQTANVSVGMPVYYWGKDFFNVIGDLQENGYSLRGYYLRNFNRAMASSYTNLDNPSINGLFEVRGTELSYTGTKPYTGFYPFLNIKTPDNIAMMQLAGTTGNLYYRGKQSANVTMSGNSWAKIRDSANWGVSLFDNSSGTAGTVTLSEASANFDYLEIYYLDTVSSKQNSQRIMPSVSNVFAIDGMALASPVSLNYVTNYSLSGQTITITSSAGFQRNYTTGTISGALDNYIKIYKVIGYR